ncbi:MAG TPA: FlgD immunoglobulin-like domain containing protein [Fimbriimonadaceae bacterium]|nr:FlgD immunoglobulin-like domain containing protein [Fimbriimonadaceae bacterium]
MPNNLRFHITDLATGTTRDLRRASGYTFTADKAGAREFKVTVEEGAVSRAVIGNVVVSQTGRAAGDRNAPITISYTLSSAAATSVRILASNGKEVYVASRGRADQAGENTITWTLRDKANRAVAPGTYRAEIVAETSSGERVRKVIAVNVIR